MIYGNITTGRAGHLGVGHLGVGHSPAPRVHAWRRLPASLVLVLQRLLEVGVQRPLKHRGRADLGLPAPPIPPRPVPSHPTPSPWYLQVPVVAAQGFARRRRAAARDGGELGAQRLPPLHLLRLHRGPPFPYRRRRHLHGFCRAQRGGTGRAEGAGAVPGRGREAAVRGSMPGGAGLAAEGLREAMRYMVESQGFDRVLRKVRRCEGARRGRFSLRNNPAP